ncbi:3-hydroxyacyl-CoA dehydrogenase/enoyl-CoA hydratase family protein [Aliamphritea hakodatensis]|uniref:3-hydroxyacyl-CoA dehydrogenase/enoyl-CoA hydratase family protein n=1 Tax=Aliamphritea hakodatensis TaxID=2895352 RepID=UPI0022FD3E69|nr:3-hydroxyacyl-CoA dehydrogenase/enoyl-CoA hydratase family protein [Aliamphritea hakodatensis]
MSTSTFKKVAVIGAGTMGAGIAGQVANAGIEVWLLDLASEGEQVNALAERGMERLQDPDAPGLMSDAAAENIHLGNIRDDFDQLADCDWIAEAVVERLDIKQDLYRRINDVCRDDAIITSNTSTIPISLLTQGMPQSFCERFAITHFFNPVRFMRLLELVRGEQTRDDVMARLDAFCDQQLGKGVVHCADTPGFLGNRVGVYAIQCALHTAFEMGLSPAEADALFGRPMGIPKTGVFGLYDLIGIDLMSDVVKSLVNILPAEDDFHRVAAEIPLMSAMIANGQTGNKNGQGFFRDVPTENPDLSTREVLNLSNNEYQPYTRLELPLALKAEAQGVQVLLDDDSRYGKYAWQVLSRTLCYAASLIPEVGDDIVPVDDAMKLGYNWVQGPFELLDQIGTERFVTRLEAEGRTVPALLQQTRGDQFYRVAGNQLFARRADGSYPPIQRAEGVLRFSELRRTLTPQNSNAVASWFIVEDAAIVEFHSKANALDGDSMAILEDALQQAAARGLRGVIIHNDAQHFSCGVNLGAVQRFYQAEDYEDLDHFLNHFQQVVLAMRNSPVPVVAAPSGLSIGGGFEVVLHADQVICHANSVTGLVESLVGVVPGGGGVKETLYRNLAKFGDIKTASMKAFMNLGYGRTGTSPIISKKLAMLRDQDQWLMNRDRLLNHALNALDKVEKAPAREPVALAGEPLYTEMCDWLHKARAEGQLYPHDVVVGTEIAGILTGGQCAAGTLHTEQDLFAAERRAFLRLVKTPETRARIDSMLGSGSSIRN